MARTTYAPRGAIKAKPGDPLRERDPMRCSARSKRKGTQCTKAPIPGGTVCRYHGGAAPQVRKAALERLTAYQDRAIDRLFGLVEQETFPSTAYQAVRDVLDRTMGKPAESVAVEHSGALTVRWMPDE